MKDMIYYAVYGSNLNYKRFFCYITGGIPEGALSWDQGCHENTPLPKDGGGIEIPYGLYFAKVSSKWSKGSVAFLSTIQDFTIKTLGRKYLISRNQFIDIFKQENSIDVRENIFIDFDAIKKTKARVVNDNWYGKIVYLGDSKETPIFTLTASWKDGAQQFKAPSEAYLMHIIQGIKQTFDLTMEQIKEYLMDKPGIKDSYSSERLLNLIAHC
jgi:hypothetical protein